MCLLFHLLIYITNCEPDFCFYIDRSHEVGGLHSLKNSAESEKNSASG